MGNKLRFWLTSTTIRRWEILVLYLMVAATVYIGLRLVDERYQNARDAASTAVAVQVQIEATLRNDKVCSASNTGPACRSLFNRLASSIDQNQRRILACRVADSLKRPDLAKNISCSDLPDRISIP